MLQVTTGKVKLHHIRTQIDDIGVHLVIIYVSLLQIMVDISNDCKYHSDCFLVRRP